MKLKRMMWLLFLATVIVFQPFASLGAEAPAYERLTPQTSGISKPVDVALDHWI